MALTSQRRWQIKMQNSGRCVECGEERDCDSVSKCLKCLKKHRANYKKKGGPQGRPSLKSDNS